MGKRARRSRLPKPEIDVAFSGSITTLMPLSERAGEWIADNLYTESWQRVSCRFGYGAHVEARYALDIIAGAGEAGFVLVRS